MPQQARPPLLVIGLEPLLPDVFQCCLQDLTEQGRLQSTMGIGNDPVAPLGIKAADSLSVLHANRVLCLVPVSRRRITAQNGQKNRVQSADPDKRILHHLLFDGAFRLVGHMPEGASAAGCINRAIRLNPIQGRLLQLFDDAEGVGGHGLDDSALQLVPNGSPGDEHRLPFDPADPIALRRHAGNGQGYNFIFLSHVSGAPQSAQ
ncbi:uncharacterized protein BN633_01907 [Ruminococcus sp. CAG:379]|nr:uncharacterized protein BN633_01907 [Ruminococcus sp. CAG:379]